MSKEKEIVDLFNKEMDELVDDYAKRRIADLEAKLAESENCACKHIGELTKIATEKDRKIEELKQHLAEKDEEIRDIFAKYQYYKRKYDLDSYDKSLKSIKRKCLKALTHQHEDKGE